MVYIPDPEEVLKKEKAQYRKNLLKKRIMMGIGPVGAALKVAGIAAFGFAASLGLAFGCRYLVDNASRITAGWGALASAGDIGLAFVGIAGTFVGALGGSICGVGGLYAIKSAIIESYNDRLSDLYSLQGDWERREKDLNYKCQHKNSTRTPISLAKVSEIAHVSVRKKAKSQTILRSPFGRGR